MTGRTLQRKEWSCASSIISSQTSFVLHSHHGCMIGNCLGTSSNKSYLALGNWFDILCLWCLQKIYFSMWVTEYFIAIHSITCFTKRITNWTSRWRLVRSISIRLSSLLASITLFSLACSYWGIGYMPSRPWFGAFCAF